MTCSTCPVASSCHNPRRPAAVCHDRSGFWSLEVRTEWEELFGRSYPPIPAINYDREQIDAARRLLESKGYRVVSA